MSRLDKFGSHNDRWTKDVRYNSRPAWKVLVQIANALGKQFGFENTEEIFTELCKKEFGLADMDYEKVGENGFVIEKVNV
jgi:predicted molibdopterin-dependent oxidoreductase YjgC